jgi:tubulin alpha
MREVISLHVGGAGIGMGTTAWALLQREHGLDGDGRHRAGGAGAAEAAAGDVNAAGDAQRDETPMRTLFAERERGTFEPRAILCDLGASAPLEFAEDDVERGIFGLNPDRFLVGEEGTEGSCARARYGSGTRLLEPVLEQIRHAAEECDGLQGFSMFHSADGGTGSGFGSLLLERLSDDFGKKWKLALSLFNELEGPQSDQYRRFNAVHSANALIEHADLVFPLENEALRRMCREDLVMNQPTNRELNGVVGAAWSSMTSSWRLPEGRGGHFGVDVTSAMSFVPYPRLHFFNVAFAPIQPNGEHDHPTVSDITQELFRPHSSLSMCDVSGGKMMNAMILYRGRHVTPRLVNAAVHELRENQTVQFVDWSPSGFRCGIQPEPPLGMLAREEVSTALLVANNTCVGSLFGRLALRFDSGLSDRSAIASLGSGGLSEDDLDAARENIGELMVDYSEVQLTASEGSEGSEDY